MKKDDAISSFYAELSARYPELPGPLIFERGKLLKLVIFFRNRLILYNVCTSHTLTTDMYLAWSLKRSKAVNGAQAVVGVIGRGHLRGVLFSLGQDSGILRFSDLVGRRNNRDERAKDTTRAVARFLLETLLVTAIYLIFTQWNSI